MINFHRAISKISILYFILFFSIPTYGLDSIPSTEKKTKLIIRGSNNYPPYEFNNSEGNPDGFNVEFMRALLECVQIKPNEYDLKLEPWDSLVSDIENKKADIIIGLPLSIFPNDSLHYSLPICSIKYIIISNDKSNIQNLGQLIDKKVIVREGGWAHNFLTERKITDKFIFSSNPDSNLNKLLNNDAEAIIGNEMLYLDAIKTHKNGNFKVANLGTDTEKYSIAVISDNYDLVDKLNIGIKNLSINGEYINIYDKWFGIYEYKDYLSKTITIFAIGLLIVTSLLIFIWFLYRRISSTTRQLKYNQQQFKLAFDAGQILAWSFDIKNPIIHALHGEASGVAGKNIFDVIDRIDPEDRERVRNCINRIISGDISEATENFRMLSTNDYNMHSFETKMLHMEETRDHPAMIVGTLKDTTDEIALRETLEDYQVKTNFITKTNGLILFCYEVSDNIIYRLNVQDNSVRRTYLIEEYLTIVHPHDIKKAEKLIESMRPGNIKHVSAEYRMLSDENVYEWYAIEAMAYKHDSEGKITSYLGLRRLNTKWKKANDDLIELRNQAEASNKLKSAFLANMSHEIRTPLNSIVGFSDLIVDSDDPSEKEQYRNIIQSNNELLLQLVNDVLDLSKIEAGFVDFKYTHFDLNSFFKEIYTSLQMRVPSGVTLINNAPNVNLELYSDKNRVTQIITNFVTNAFKFTTQGTVTLNYKYEEDWVTISVTDTGLGISEENQPKIFDRFEKLNEFAQGTGLGLSICKSLVEAMNGCIGVESKLGKGSTFWIKLPFTPDMEYLTDEKDSNSCPKDIDFNFTSNDQETEIDIQRPTILIAEDIDNNYLLAKLILKEDYNVVRATNGLEAVQKAYDLNPDIILMDMKMPIMDGLTATQKIREFNNTTPIIALTAYVLDTNRDEAMRCGCTGFIAKPLKREKLNQELNNHKKEYKN